jgi:hypothetical protein
LPVGPHAGEQLDERQVVRRARQCVADLCVGLDSRRRDQVSLERLGGDRRRGWVADELPVRVDLDHRAVADVELERHARLVDQRGPGPEVAQVGLLARPAAKPEAREALQQRRSAGGGGREAARELPGARWIGEPDRRDHRAWRHERGERGGVLTGDRVEHGVGGGVLGGLALRGGRRHEPPPRQRLPAAVRGVGDQLARADPDRLAVRGERLEPPARGPGLDGVDEAVVLHRALAEPHALDLAGPVDAGRQLGVRRRVRRLQHGVANVGIGLDLRGRGDRVRRQRVPGDRRGGRLGEPGTLERPELAAVHERLEPDARIVRQARLAPGVRRRGAQSERAQAREQRGVARLRHPDHSGELPRAVRGVEPDRAHADARWGQPGERRCVPVGDGIDHGLHRRVRRIGAGGAAERSDEEERQGCSHGLAS